MHSLYCRKATFARWLVFCCDKYKITRLQYIVQLETGLLFTVFLECQSVCTVLFRIWLASSKSRGQTMVWHLSTIYITKPIKYSLLSWLTRKQRRFVFTFRTKFLCPQPNNYSFPCDKWYFTDDRQTSETLSDICVCLCLLQSPTARRCGWWCLWCACRWWLSPSSSLSSSAPWDTIAACRAPRVRDAVSLSARQSTHRHCSFHNFITNLSLHHLCKQGGGWFKEGIYAKHPPFFLTAHESKQSLHTHDVAYLFLMKQMLTVRWWVILTFLQYLSVYHLFCLLPAPLCWYLHTIIWKCYLVLPHKLSQEDLYSIGVTQVFVHHLLSVL